MIAIHSNFLKWAKQLNSKVPSLGARIRRTACEKLSADGTAQAVPFLVSALANSNQEVRRIAEEGLKSLDKPESVDVLSLSYVFTRQESLQQILKALGWEASEKAEVPAVEPGECAPEFTAAEEAWQL
ncbi:MAG: HEAT repeat domain-containing protein, partial [Planctomycetota bacterium]